MLLYHYSMCNLHLRKLIKKTHCREVILFSCKLFFVLKKPPKNINSLSDIWFLNIFSHFTGWLFTTISFAICSFFLA